MQRVCEATLNMGLWRGVGQRHPLPAQLEAKYIFWGLG